MRIVVHKNDMKGVIKTPTISIMESEITSAEEIIKKIDKSLTPVIVNQKDLPDNWFHRAWDIVDGKVIVDMEKAREIHKERIRAGRIKKLAELDIEFQRAMEKNKSTKDIVSQKQKLRDATEDPKLNSAQTTEELKSIWYQEFGTRYDRIVPPGMDIESKDK